METTAPQAISRPAVSAGRLVAIVLGGPPIGIIVYVLGVAVVDTAFGDPGEMLEILGIMLILGWPLGMVPAALAALVWRLVPLPDGLWSRIGLAAAIGAVCGPLGMAGVMALLEVEAMSLPIVAMFALAGAAALITTAIPLSGARGT